MHYQYLHYDFFTTCRKRKINKTPILQERGVIDFISGKGPKPTQYLILDSVLAPEKVDKTKPGVAQIRPGSGHIVQSIYKSYQKNEDKSHFERFKGMSEQDKVFLKEKGIF